MNKEKALSMLGIARRAGALSMGHDMAVESIRKGKAECLLFCADVSPRLFRDFEITAEKSGWQKKAVRTELTMDEVGRAAGYRAGVITVNDKNLAKKICELLDQEENEW